MEVGYKAVLFKLWIHVKSFVRYVLLSAFSQKDEFTLSVCVCVCVSVCVSVCE